MSQKFGHTMQPPMRKALRYFRVLLLSISLLSSTAPAAFGVPYRLDIIGSRLTADLENAPLSAVINDIGARTGIKFLYVGDAAAAGLSRPFSARFNSVSVRTALEKLLAQINYSLIFDGDDNIRQVFILGSKSAGSSGPRIQPPFVAAPNSAADSRVAPAASSPGQEIETGAGEETPGAEEISAAPDEVKDGPPGEAGAPEEMLIRPGGQDMNPGSLPAEAVSANPPDRQSSYQNRLLRKRPFSRMKK